MCDLRVGPSERPERREKEEGVGARGGGGGDVGEGEGVTAWASSRMEIPTAAR